MSLKFDGDYYAKATDAGPRVPPSFPSEPYKRHYDEIRWNNKETTMDLSKEDPKRIATLIVNGNLQLGQVPSMRRPLVQAEIDRMTEELKKPKKAEKKESKNASKK